MASLEKGEEPASSPLSRGKALPSPLPYDLPDAGLLVEESESLYRALAWIPRQQAIVLGCGSDASQAYDSSLACEAGIPVYRRPSGGETMFLSPAMAAISLAVPCQNRFQHRRFFEKTGDHIMAVLAHLGVKDLGVRGTSDIVVGERKIMGSALYQRKGGVFFHAVINVAEDPHKIGHYLRHPLREPAYRQGRPHESFVTSLHQAGYPLPVKAVREALEAAFMNGHRFLGKAIEQQDFPT